MFNFGHKNNEWWRGGAIYQIYPRSFMDSNADGIGDLPGITEKLDYIASLGVDAVWISPFFTSPMKDFGYDVSDYKDVDPIFGTLRDFDELLKTAHELGLKIIIDLVISHTSVEHEWFQQSCKSKNNPKADWYVWADPKPDGSPPTNWQSYFGGAAWTFQTSREQYYLHNFLKEQPDLNYHNPEVQDAILNIAKFWLDKGVDGFRLDTVNYYTHDKQLRDNPPKPQNQGTSIQYKGLWPYTMQLHLYDKSQSENLDFIEKLRALTDQYEDRFLMGEISDDDQIKTTVEYTHGDKRLHAAYSFALLGGQNELMTAQDFAAPIIEEYTFEGDSWPSWAFSNHDVIRSATRWIKNNPNHSYDFYKVTLAILACLRGTFCIYQGEELGLNEAELKFEHLVDPWGIALWPEWQGRDGCRTPIPWNEFKPNAAFSEKEGMPWLPVCRKHYPLSVRQQELDPHSVLNFIKDFLHWRKGHQVLKTGDIEFFDHGESVLVFRRYNEQDDLLCVFNLSDQNHKIDMSDYKSLVFGSEASLSGSTLSLFSFGLAIMSPGGK